jgi:hypothetical protein
MKVGDLVQWKHSDFIADDIGIVIEVPDYSIATDQYDPGDRMITVYWQKNSTRVSAKIRAHYLEVVPSGRRS